jgi:hypothetical protein
MIWLIRALLLVLGMLFTAPLILEASNPQKWSILLFCDLCLFGLAELARTSYEKRTLGEMNVRKRPKLNFLLLVSLGVCGLAISITHALVSDYKTALYGLVIGLFVLPSAFRRPFF